MDPYLERHWGDIHHSLVQYARDQLQEQLPDELHARLEERVFVDSATAPDRSIFPDVRIIERSRRFQAAAPLPVEQTEPDDGGVAVAEPILVHYQEESMTEGFIEIRDGRSGNRVVTVIEVLSLANKTGKNGMAEYLKKQEEVLAGDVNLVEIDLLRKGRRVTALPQRAITALQRKAYQICVCRASAPSVYEFYPVTLRERLPRIRIPLRPEDRDVTLDLQLLVDQAYRLGRYDDLNYSQPLDPPLEAEDGEWVRALVGKATA